MRCLKCSIWDTVVVFDEGKALVFKSYLDENDQRDGIGIS